MVKRLSGSLRLSALRVNSHDAPSDFYLSSWQRGDSPVPMLVVRALLASAAGGILAWSLASSPTPYWLIYLTNWGLLLITLLTLSGLLVSAIAVRKGLPDGGALPWFVRAYWVLHNVAIPLAVVITALYWILLYSPGRGGWLDVATHGLNSCVALGELATARTPLRAAHAPQPLGVGLWYAAFSALYFAAGGTDPAGNPYIYEILDWRRAERAAPVAAAATLGLLGAFGALWAAARARRSLSAALVRAASVDLPPAPPDRYARGLA